MVIFQDAVYWEACEKQYQIILHLIDVYESCWQTGISMQNLIRLLQEKSGLGLHYFPKYFCLSIKAYF